MTPVEHEPAIDGRRAEQSMFTGGDQDTGLPDLSHQDAIILTPEEKANGLELLRAMRESRLVLNNHDFHERHETISDWAAAREKDNIPTLDTKLAETKPVITDLNEEVSDLAVKSKAKEPVVPFMPLEREIGPSRDPDTPIVEITEAREDKIDAWVARVTKAYDRVQKAEGDTNPWKVYHGSAKKAAKKFNEIDPVEKTPELVREQAIAESMSQVAALRQVYRTTGDHLDAVTYKLQKSQGMQLRMYHTRHEMTAEDGSVVNELLQELGNGVAANLDSIFSDDAQARIAGNSILAVADSMLTSPQQAKEHKKLVIAAVKYAVLQQKIFKAKLNILFNFAVDRRIALVRKDPAA